MSCYFQACSQRGQTREHVPPKSFFPKDQRDQLLTVPSCEHHNNAKSSDDMYVLAHICMNASPANRSREVFRQSVVPQLGLNGNALGKMLLRDADIQLSGAVAYRVDKDRFDKFFTALSCGIIYKACGASVPAEYRFGHIYHGFKDDAETLEERAVKLAALHSGKPIAVLNFRASQRTECNRVLS